MFFAAPSRWQALKLVCVALSHPSCIMAGRDFYAVISDKMWFEMTSDILATGKCFADFLMHESVEEAMSSPRC